MIPKNKFLDYVGRRFGDGFRRGCLIQLIGSGEGVTPQCAVRVMTKAVFDAIEPVNSAVPNEAELVAAVS